MNNITDDLDAHIFNLSEDEAALPFNNFLFKEYQGRKMLVDIFSGYPANIKSNSFLTRCHIIVTSATYLKVRGKIRMLLMVGCIRC